MSCTLKFGGRPTISQCECQTPKDPALALRDKILEQVPPMGTELKTVKHKLSDPNVNNAVVLMDIEVIRNMTMFPIC